MGDAPAGETWVLLVVKQANTNFVYYDPIAGHTYPSIGDNAPGYSHIIVCSSEELPPPSGWACVDGSVEFIEDATDFEGTLYDTEEEAANDPACAEEPPSGWACVDGSVEFIEDATDFEGTLYDTEEEAANDPACAEVQAAIFVTVTGECQVLDSGPAGVIEVNVSVAGGADVTIRDSEGAVIATLSEDGTVTVPQGRTYTWEATQNEGFQFPEGYENTGTIDIGTCDEVLASIVVTVSGSCVLVGDGGQGNIEVGISVAGGATVVVRNASDTVVGTFTGDGTAEVPEGATYTWEATANEGFEFPSGTATSGSITIETCSNPETLPFTGPEDLWMAPLAALLMAAGAFLVRGSRRFGEHT
jgi:hypothetical protein